MPTDTLIRIVALCVVLAGAETLHGIVRMVWVVPRIGKDLAIRLSALTGSLLALGICWLLVPPIGLTGAAQHLAVGCRHPARPDSGSGRSDERRAGALWRARVRPRHLRTVPRAAQRQLRDRACVCVPYRRNVCR